MGFSGKKILALSMAALVAASASGCVESAIASESKRELTSSTEDGAEEESDASDAAGNSGTLGISHVESASDAANISDIAGTSDTVRQAGAVSDVTGQAGAASDVTGQAGAASDVTGQAGAVSDAARTKENPSLSSVDDIDNGLFSENETRSELDERYADERYSIEMTSPDTSYLDDLQAEDEIDVLAVYGSLIKTDSQLGLAGKYKSVSDVDDSSIDPGLIGQWFSVDGSFSFAFSDSGYINSYWRLYDSESEMPFTTIKTDRDSVIAMNTIGMSLSEDNEASEYTEISYDCYLLKGDILFMASVEDTDDDYASFLSQMKILYKADGGGDYSASVARNPISLSSLYGKWESDDGTLKFDKNGLTIGGKTYKATFNSEGRLVVDINGKKSAYEFALNYRKDYTAKDKKEVSDAGYVLVLNFTGKDQYDRPNLEEFMVDWKTAYGWDDWYYTANFDKVG